MDLFVGQSSLRGELARYARHLNFLELLAEPSLLPKLTKLAGYRKQAPTFPFSVVLSPHCFDAPSPATTRVLEYGLSVAQALEATWLVVRTPPTVRPGPAGEKRLEQFIAGLPAGTHQIAWDARGLWEMATVQKVSARLKITPVLDASNVASWGAAPIEGACYTRLLGIGVAQRPSETLLARLLERVIGCEHLYLVVDGPSAVQTRQALVTLLEDLGDFDGEDDDDEDDEATDDEDDEAADDEDDEAADDDERREEEE
jgi:uncharacterized protein YecE (DUF72 family)